MNTSEIHKWNDSHWKLIGDWQKHFVQPKHPNWIMQERPKSYGLGHVHWQGTQRRRKVTWVDPTRRVRDTYWVLQPWGPTPRKWVPLAGWRTDGRKNRAVGRLDSTNEYTHTSCSQKRVESVGWDGMGVWPVSPESPVVCLSLSWGSVPALLASWHSSTQRKGILWQRRAWLSDT